MTKRKRPALTVRRRPPPGGFTDGEQTDDGELNVLIKEGSSWIQIGRILLSYDVSDTTQPYTVKTFWHITDPTRFATVSVGTLVKLQIVQWPVQKSGYAYTVPTVTTSEKWDEFDASKWEDLEDESEVSPLVQTDSGLPKKSRWNVCDVEPSNGNPMDGDDGGPLGLMYRQTENSVFTGDVYDQWVVNAAFVEHLGEGATIYLKSVSLSDNLDFVVSEDGPWWYWRERFTPVSGPVS
jgi:hypothetical protein